MTGTDGYPLDIQQLDADMEFILVEEAKMGSDRLKRGTNVQEYGGSRMYAEGYTWFTGASELGLVEQTAQLMDPKTRRERGGGGRGHRVVGREVQPFGETRA